MKERARESSLENVPLELASVATSIEPSLPCWIRSSVLCLNRRFLSCMRSMQTLTPNRGESFPSISCHCEKSEGAACAHLTTCRSREPCLGTISTYSVDGEDMRQSQAVPDKKTVVNEIHLFSSFCVFFLTHVLLFAYPARRQRVLQLRP